MSDKFLPKISIIDYGMGNLFSVAQACEHAGMDPVITSDRSVIHASNAAILPGVGAFKDAMDYLQKMDLVEPIKDFIASGKPFMGICLGMQLLMSESEEFGHHKGLDIIKGDVARLRDKDSEGKGNKIPHVGWNRIRASRGDGFEGWTGTPLEGVNDGEFMYFVHSYYARPLEKGSTLSTTEYGGCEYCSGLLNKNVFGVQFHPEKSSYEGMKIYRNWARYIKNKGASGG